MKICTFDEDRVGVVVGDKVADVTPVVAPCIPLAWPMPMEDPFIARLAEIRPLIEEALPKAASVPLAKVKLRSPVPNPGKIIGVPVNYQQHINESRADATIHHGWNFKDLFTDGLFLKSSTALVGPSEGVRLRFPDRRNDHEIELVVVIGRKADRVSSQDALKYVAAYSIGLDMTVRGTEVRSFRKSPDTYAVLGPWMVTADEFGDPGNVGLRLTVNGKVHQEANTRDLLVSVPRLIEYASLWYSLNPGDLIYTGTCEGVSPVKAGDRMTAEIERIGSMDVTVS